MSRKRENQWLAMLFELWNRFINAMSRPKFIFYFSSGILLIGGIGVWLPYLRYLETPQAINLFHTPNLVTFTTALLGTMWVNSTLSQEDNSILKQPAIFFGLLAFCISIYGYFLAPASSSAWCTWGAIVALILFILIQSSDDIFDDEPKSASTGYKKPKKQSLKDK